jgi:hypothetical protein
MQQEPETEGREVVDQAALAQALLELPTLEEGVVVLAFQEPQVLEVLVLLSCVSQTLALSALVLD